MPHKIAVPGRWGDQGCERCGNPFLECGHANDVSFVRQRPHRCWSQLLPQYLRCFAFPCAVHRRTDRCRCDDFQEGTPCPPGSSPSLPLCTIVRRRNCICWTLPGQLPPAVLGAIVGWRNWNKRLPVLSSPNCRTPSLTSRPSMPAAFRLRGPFNPHLWKGRLDIFPSPSFDCLVLFAFDHRRWPLVFSC